MSRSSEPVSGRDPPGRLRKFLVPPHRCRLHSARCTPDSELHHPCLRACVSSVFSPPAAKPAKSWRKRNLLNGIVALAADNVTNVLTTQLGTMLRNGLLKAPMRLTACFPHHGCAIIPPHTAACSFQS